jgi:hypothetical protein
MVKKIRVNRERRDERESLERMGGHRAAVRRVPSRAPEVESERTVEGGGEDVK